MNDGEFQFLKFISHLQQYFELDSEFPMLEKLSSQFGSSGKFLGKKSNGVVFYEINNLISKNGSETSGVIVYLPMMPEEILLDQNKSAEMVLNICHDLVEYGVDIIGLGGFTGILGNRGEQFREQLPVEVTTGNIFTAYNAIAALDCLCKQMDIDLINETVVVVGFPGSIGVLISRYLSRRTSCSQKMVLVGRGSKKYLERYVEGNQDYKDNIELCSSAIEGVQKGRIIITATSSGNIIEEDQLPRGAVVIDVAAPRDIKEPLTKRTDILVVDGGRCSFTDEVKWQDNPVTKIIKNNLYGCVLETILLALDNKIEPFSIGRDLSVEKLDQIGSMAEKHGMVVDTLFSYGKRIEASRIRAMKKLFNASTAPQMGSIHDALSMSQNDVVNNYSNYMNPMIADLWKFAAFARLFKKAEGMFLWDDSDNKYLDFVGGYGSVNFGHNHPTVIEGIQTFLNSNAPSLVQVAPPAVTTLLAQNISKLVPGDLEVSFFCNSGTEAVEAALKLARTVSGRKWFVSTEGSFHGKTFGSLSVSGREKYKTPYRPLLKHSINIPFGDVDALEEIFQNKQVAAFIVEPIQGEAGVIVPPTNYLTDVRKLCTQYGVLMIVDEIQTGFGRTGKNFAVDHENIIPDIMTISKSMGGGIAPIGACVTNRRLWDMAYASPDKYALHTSTFGGNNLAASAAIQATKLLVEEKFADKADKMGTLLTNKLKDLQTKIPFIKDVRGKGLMIGIQFDMNYAGGLKEICSQLIGYADQELFNLMGLLTDNMNDRISDFATGIVSDTEQYMKQNFLIQISALLLKKYRILTFSTLNNPDVLRIQPPLTISEKEIDIFIDALHDILSVFNFKL